MGGLHRYDFETALLGKLGLFTSSSSHPIMSREAVSGPVLPRASALACCDISQALNQAVGLAAIIAISRDSNEITAI